MFNIDVFEKTLKGGIRYKMTLMEILDSISVLNRDNGRIFTNTNRLEAIEECLWNIRYKRINPQGLFHLYSLQPVNKIMEPVVIVSSHAYSEENITRCFSKTLSIECFVVHMLNLSKITLNCFWKRNEGHDTRRIIEIIYYDCGGIEKKKKIFEGNNQDIMQYLGTQKIFISIKKLAKLF